MQKKMADLGAEREENRFSQCAICLEPMGLDGQDRVYRLPCTHEFHVDCIMQSFRQGDPRCPLCRDGEEIQQQRAREELDQVRNMFIEAPHLADLNLLDILIDDEDDDEDDENDGDTLISRRQRRLINARRNRRARESPTVMAARDRFWEDRSAVFQADRVLDDLCRQVARAERVCVRRVRAMEKSERKFYRLADRRRR